MYFQLNVSKQLVKSGGLRLNYNKYSLFKKYELGYLDIVQDIDNTTGCTVSSPYSIFRPIFKTSNYDKAVKKLKDFEYLTIKISS
jgi:hypothetical protein